MKALRKKNLAQISILGCVIGTSLVITPNFSAEPVDLPKLALLVPLAFLVFGFLTEHLRSFFSSAFRIPAFIFTLLLAYFTLVLFVSGAPFNQQFFGTFGRNTGYLAYVSLILLAFGSMVCADKRMIRLVAFSLLATGFCTAFYGALQVTKNDPVSWNNPYNPIIGFLGNPDFASAFLGISFVVGIGLLLDNKLKPRVKIFIVILEVLSILLIVKSHAQQGLIVAGIGFTVTIFIYLLKNRFISNVITGLFGIISLIAGTFVVLGIFKLGPLSNLLYKLSVRQRGFYWHAAIRMMNDHPFFGIGLDSYGDNYFKYRSANAALHSPQTQSNAAHNVFLDIGSTGGYLLLSLYLILIIFTLLSALKVIKKTESFNSFFVAIFAAWLGFQAQSLVSINQLGLAVWGWMLTGLIIGYRITIEVDAKLEYPLNTTRAPKNKVNSGRVRLAVPLICTVVGMMLSIPPFMADRGYRLAMQSRDGNRVIQSAGRFPIDTGRSLSVAQLLASNKLVPQALNVLKEIIKINPKNYNAWVLIAQISDPKSELHIKALSRLKELNPRVSNLGI
jgi:O-antigen ligase